MNFLDMTQKNPGNKTQFHVVIMSLQAPQSLTVSQSLLGFQDFGSLGEHSSGIFVECPSICNLHLIRLALWGLRINITEVKCPSLHGVSF